MHRCGSGFLLTLAIIFVLALTACLGKSSSNNGNGGVTSVTLSPSTTLSLDVGGTQVFSASAKDALGRVVLGANIQLLVVSGNPGAPAPLSIASNGNACAGTWDASVAICSPGTSGIALVTAVTEGVSSPTTFVYVHQHIDSIKIVNDENQDPPYACFSQEQTWQYKGIAFSNNVDITNTVGPINWSSSNVGVVTVTPIVSGQPPNQQLNQVTTTAKSPGITQLFASVSGTTSNPYPYTTCLVRYIRLQIGGQAAAGNSVSVNNGGSVPITATAIDSLYNIVDFGPLKTPPLTWSTTNPEVAAFTTVTNDTGTNSATARANLGGATLTASCSPPTCNIGVLPGLPVYASNGPLPNGTQGYGAISVDVASTSKPPTYTAWAATTGCQNAPGCSSALFSVTPTSGTNPIGSIVGLPRTPNSMMFNHLSTQRLYIGSDQGLMYVDVSGTSPSATLVSGSPTPCNVSLCGKVLTISNDGKLVVVADNVSTPSQVHIFNAGSTSGTPVDLIIPGQTPIAAAFSPDQLKLFILTSTGNMYVYSTVDALSSVPVATSVTDLAFSADGSFAYVAGDSGTPGNSISGYSTCSSAGVPTQKLGNGATSAVPLKIFPTMNVQAHGPVLVSTGPNSGQPSLTQEILALEPPNIEILQTQFTQQPTAIDISDAGKMTCDLPAVSNPNAQVPIPFLTKGPSFNLGQGNFTPIYTQLVADDSEMILVAKNIPAVLLFDTTNGTTTSVPLVGSADPLAASASTDGSQVFVAACDQYDPEHPTTCAVGSIHIINTISQGDIQQVPYVNVNDNNNRNMCSNNGNPAPLCLPDMVAIRPQ
ncbi:MAG: hypothetical protein LAO30_11595 [Acidobacteriia bacterium]|nr:hypothetical protein [Terriglobia bacterium]